MNVLRLLRQPLLVFGNRLQPLKYFLDDTQKQGYPGLKVTRCVFTHVPVCMAVKKRPVEYDVALTASRDVNWWLPYSLPETTYHHNRGSPYGVSHFWIRSPK